MSRYTKKGPHAFLVCGSSNRMSPIWATDAFFCQKRPQSLYYMSANSKGSGVTALIGRLAWTFAGRLCDILFSCAGSNS